jgi:hypothetical protein
MRLNARGRRVIWAVVVVAALVFSASVVAQGWLIFRAHGGTLDLAYLNKRLDGHLFVTMPVVTAYLLIAYAVLSRAWRRSEPVSLGAICGRGALAAVPPAAILLVLGSPVLAILATGLGVTTFGWTWVILTGGEAASLGRGLRRGLSASAILSVCAGLAFTLWLVWTMLWRDLNVGYFVGKEGVIAYAPVAVVGSIWFVASCGAVLGVCSFSLFLALMIRSLGGLVVRSGGN